MDFYIHLLTNGPVWINPHFPNILSQKYIVNCLITIIVVVALLFYVHGKHLRSFGTVS